MNKQIVVQVSTQALRKLLEDDVEAFAKLNSFACEKIAQEITEKAKKIDTEAAKRVLRDVLQETVTNLKDGYRFPTEARDFIKKAVFDHYRAVMSAELVNVKQELRKFVEDEIARINKFNGSIVQEMIDAEHKRLTGLIKTTARTEFLGVLTEVRRGIE